MVPGPHGSLTLFLDFDGVTHPDRARPERQFEAVPLIEKVLRQHPEVELVLSTSWRETYPLDELRYLFSIDISERIVGMTPIYSGDRPWPALPFERAQKTRHAECQMWLYQNRSLEHPWIAVDDRPWWFDPECKNVFAVDLNTGFTVADQEPLSQMIRTMLADHG